MVVVEDDLLIAMDIEMQVAAGGHHVVATATCADEAVAVVLRTRPDVVLMDLRLARGTSGIDAARRLHERDGTRCIFLSGNVDPATARSLEPLAPVAVLSKPFQPAMLQQALGGVPRRPEP
ncbi:response regulator [Acuticoccus sp.]|uniref:response regulator n=1 Tax=Acuticoccus sp. TaxID=1904378 RepID=UPI003B52954F